MPGPTTPPIGTRYSVGVNPQSTGQDLGLLSGPTSAPAGAVTIQPGSYSVRDATAANPPGTTFWLAPGIHACSNPEGTDVFAQIQAKDGNTYIGHPDAVLDGLNKARKSFTSGANVTLRYLHIRNFVPPNDEYSINPDSRPGWKFYGIHMHDCDNGINLGSNSVLSYSYIHNMAQYAYATYGSPTGTARTNAVDNVEVHHIECHDCGKLEREYTIVPGSGGPFGVTGSSPDAKGSTGVQKFWDTRNAWVHDNWFHYNLGVCCWADTNNVDHTYEGNLIEDSFGEAIWYEISYNFVIRRNTFRRCCVFKGMLFAFRGDDFPCPAVYLSEAGGDSTVALNNALSYIGGEAAADGNTFENNHGEVMLWENADRYANSPANTSGSIWKTMGTVSGQVSSLGLCNVPTAKTITAVLTAGSVRFTTDGAFIPTDEGRAISGTGIPAGALIPEPFGANAGGWATSGPGQQGREGVYYPGGDTRSTVGHMSAAATASGTITMTLAAGAINTEPGYTLCRWRTQNIRVKNNYFSVDPAVVQAIFPNVVRGSNTRIGVVGIFANYGSYPSWSPYQGAAAAPNASRGKIDAALNFNQNNVWQSNSYAGPHYFQSPRETYNAFAAWQAAPFNQDAGSTYTTTPGAGTGPSYTPPPAAPNPAPAVAPTITTQPANRSVTVGQTASFSVVATGTTPLAYQWQHNRSGVFADFVGTPSATTATLQTGNAVIGDNALQVRCRVSNAAGALTSATATLTVTAAPAPPPDAPPPPATGTGGVTSSLAAQLVTATAVTTRRGQTA